LALLALFSHGLAQAESLTLISVPLPIDVGELTIGVFVSTLTVITLTLVSLVGAIVTTYARNYMASDAR